MEEAPGMPGAFAASGNGNGILCSAVAARLTADGVAAAPNALSSRSRIGRSRCSSGVLRDCATLSSVGAGWQAQLHGSLAGALLALQLKARIPLRGDFRAFFVSQPHAVDDRQNDRGESRPMSRVRD